jgi:hypothetical protein
LSALSRARVLGRRSRREIQAVLKEDSSEQVLSMSGVGKRSITMREAVSPSGAGPIAKL